MPGFAIYPTHPGDVADAEARAAPPWAERGPKWQPFPHPERLMVALHKDGRAKVLTVPDGADPQELAGDEWEVVAVVKPYEEEE